jgi:hypothetical protein
MHVRDDFSIEHVFRPGFCRPDVGLVVSDLMHDRPRDVIEVGGRVATAGDDGTARLWDAESGKPLAVLQGHTGPVLSVAFSPDGGRLATASDDKTARLWIARESPEDQEKRRQEQQRLWQEQQRLWQEQQAAEAEKGGRWFAAAFHLSRLLAAGPADAALYARRGTAYALQGQWAKAAADLLQGAALCPPAADADR